MDKKQIFSRKFLFLENRSNREILSEILSRKRFYLRINKFFEEIYLEIIEKGSREDIIDLRIRVEKLNEILIKRNFSSRYFSVQLSIVSAIDVLARFNVYVMA